ncbi:DUF7948 domain-containing protein [[Eubacterium] cellulosolvens]
MTKWSIFSILILGSLLIATNGPVFEVTSFGALDITNVMENPTIGTVLINEPIPGKKMPPSGFFTENSGQWDPHVEFSASLSFGRVWLSGSFIVYDLSKPQREVTLEDEQFYHGNSCSKNTITDSSCGSIVKMTFIDANAVHPVAVELLPHKSNFFYGNKSETWITGVSNYQKVVYKELWSGVDLIYYLQPEGLKYEFLLHPGANPDIIRLQIEGHQTMKVVDNDLVIKTHHGHSIYDSGLKIYYNDEAGGTIQGTFQLLGEGVYTFKLADYDSNRGITIDPLIFSTFIGSSNIDEAWDIALDSNNNSYLTGDTKHMNFPHTPGAYDTTHNGNFDIVVFKMSPQGAGLLYSTFIGGGDYDSSHALEVDSEGNAYITGYTESTDFPNTTGAFDQDYNGGRDTFALKLNSTGSDLIYSTYIGGTDYEYGRGLAIDDLGNAYVTGYTYSNDFPISTNAFDKDHNGYADVFVLKLNSTGKGLVYSTFIGGSRSDYCRAIEITDNGLVSITGLTYSYNFPTTPSGYDTLFNGGIDIFVSKFNSDGSNLLYSTFVGGYQEDFSRDIELDEFGNAYITGYTNSDSFPISSKSYDDSYAGDEDVIVFKLNPTGSTLIYSTYIGGSYVDRGRDLVLDASGNVYVTGETYSVDFPSASSNESITENYCDAFLLKLNSNGAVLLYSTFIGGSKNDYGTDLELDMNNSVYITGYTESSDFMVTNDSYDKFFGGETDMFLAKFDFHYLPTAPHNIQIIESNQSIFLSWDAPVFPGFSDILGYRIYRGATSTSLALYDSIGAITSYNDTSVVNLQTYYYMISALNNVGEGPRSELITAAAAPKPTPPQNLNATAGNGYIVLNWQPPVSDGGFKILWYNIYRGTEPGNLTYLVNVGSESRTYNDSSVINGIVYFYQIKAENTYSESMPSNQVYAKPEGMPTPPRQLQAKAGEDYIYLSWLPPVDTGGYYIHRYRIFKGTNPGNVTYFDFVDDSVSSYNDTTGDIGVKYFYYVTAQNKLGESKPSNTVNATPFGLPEPPVNVTLVAGIGYINISWSKPHNYGGLPNFEYHIYKNHEQFEELLAVLNMSTFAYHDANVSSEVSYTYWLTTVNFVGESERSDLVHGAPLGPPKPPEQIILTSDFDLVELSWLPPGYDGGSPITKYNIYRGNESSSNTFLDSVSPFITSYRDPHVVGGQEYYYYITALNAYGESEPSYVVKGRPKIKNTEPSPPLALQAIGGNGYVNLTWSAPADDGGLVINGYIIYRGTSPGNEVKLGFISPYYLIYRDWDVINGVTYFYFLKAVNDIGESEASNKVTVTPMTPDAGGNNNGNGSDNRFLAIAWLIMLIIIIIILFFILKARRKAKQAPKNPDTEESEKSGTDLGNGSTTDGYEPPTSSPNHKLSGKDFDGPERFG